MNIISTEFIYNKNNIFFTMCLEDRHIIKLPYYYMNITKLEVFRDSDILKSLTDEEYKHFMDLLKENEELMINLSNI